MIAFLGALIGFLGSFLPSVVAYFEKKADNAYNLEIAKLNATAQENSLDVERLKTAIAEGQSLREHDSTLDGGLYFNTLRASIRPIVTYLFLGLFIVVKVTGAYVMLMTGYSIPDMVTTIWDGDTAGLWATIIAFWFGSRIFDKMAGRK